MPATAARLPVFTLSAVPADTALTLTRRFCLRHYWVTRQTKYLRSRTLPVPSTSLASLDMASPLGGGRP
eukprot:7604370-Heterocapsa_arctica.AAC.1